MGFNWLPVFVAEKQGIFARHGLQVELMRMGAVDKATAAVRAGEAELAITPPEGAVADMLGGGELRVLAGNCNCLPLTLVAHARFKRIEDLKGGVLGTSSMTEGTAIYTREMLARHGLAYKADYEFAVVGVHPARWQAMQEGRIDGAVQPPPFNFIALDAGYSDLGEVSDYIPLIMFTTLIAKQSWAQTNADKLVALMRALDEATERVYGGEDDEEIVPIMGEITNSDHSYARRALDYMRAKKAFAPALELPAAALDTTLDLMIKADLLDPAARERARAVIDDRWLRLAVPKVNAA
jgi:NitT/TauT family transport system substrate-binding protein